MSQLTNYGLQCDKSIKYVHACSLCYYYERSFDLLFTFTVYIRRPFENIRFLSVNSVVKDEQCFSFPSLLFFQDLLFRYMCRFFIIFRHIFFKYGVLLILSALVFIVNTISLDKSIFCCCLMSFSFDKSEVEGHTETNAISMCRLLYDLFHSKARQEVTLTRLDWHIDQLLTKFFHRFF